VKRVEEKKRLPSDFEQSEYFNGRDEAIIDIVEILRNDLNGCSIGSALAILEDTKKWLLESTGI
jgi:hypothetical protein